MKPNCSIVIRAYNEETHIGRLLKGISQQETAGVETILVDSGSTDRTVQIAEEYGVQIVRISPEEFTFGRSLNRGIQAAQGEFVVIVSAHCYPVYPDWLERLLAPFSEPQVALSYGKQRGDQTTKFSEGQVFARWFPDRSDPDQRHPFCNNANAAIRRSLWQVRPYDESLSGLEDLDWARWVQEQGHAIAYVAEAEVTHVHQEKPSEVYNRYRREAMAFKRIFPQEQFHFSDFARLVSSNIANDLKNAARQRLLQRSLGSIFWFRCMQFWGTYQGYRQSGELTWQLRQTFYYPQSASLANTQLTRDVEPIHYNDPNETP